MSGSFVITGSGRGVITGGFGLSIDTSELRRFAGDMNRSSARIGARTAMALRAGAYMMERAAKGAAPVDTGALRGSISTSFAGDGRSGVMAAEIGPTVDYGVFVELGTSRMGPQPYLGPAYDRHIGSVLDAIAQCAQELAA